MLEIHNQCEIPIHVKLQNFTNGSSNPGDFVLEPHQTGRAAAYVANYCKLKDVLPDNYQMTLQSADKSIIFNHEAILERAQKNTSKTSRDNHYWLLESNDLCK